jgi:hypothetical protein
MSETTTRREVTKTEVEAAFRAGGYTINERYPECGFLYFPASKPYTAENPNQGRVFWNVEKTEDPNDPQIAVCASWDFPTDKQINEILKLLALYVSYNRQRKATS